MPMPDRVTVGLAAGTGVTSDPARIRTLRSWQDGDGQEITAIRAAFPGWNIWRSDEGRWWASRRHPLRPSRWPGGYALTVAADDARALCAQLCYQPGDP
jgi:hypothetical protein